MTPAEGMRAHADLSGGEPAGVMLPIHWGTFNLAQHAWSDPAEGTVAAARELGAKIATPRVGAPFEPAYPRVDDWWWREVAPVPAGGWPVHPPAATRAAAPGESAVSAGSPGSPVAPVAAEDGPGAAEGHHDEGDYEVARPR